MMSNCLIIKVGLCEWSREWNLFQGTLDQAFENLNPNYAGNAIHHQMSPR